MPKRKFLGSGGFGQVYILEKYYPPIVVKELPGRNENDDVYKREWTVLKELAHVNVVKFIDIPPDYSDYTAGCARIFMEYCQYGTLKEAIPNPEWIYSVSTIVEWAKALFSGLVYLHGKGVIHQDIKPANLLLADNFLLKIGDFGITRRDYEAGMLCGTPGYMAPEVLACGAVAGDQNFKCDIYSAGIVIREVTVRRSPAPEQRATTNNKAFKLSPNGDGLAQLFQRTQTSDSRDRPSATEMLELYSMLGEMWWRHSKAPEHQAMAVAPEVRRGNTILYQPIGLDDTNREWPVRDLSPPAVWCSFCDTVSQRDRSGATPIIQHAAVPLKKFQLWLNKIERDANFGKLLVLPTLRGRLAEFYEIIYRPYDAGELHPCMPEHPLGDALWAYVTAKTSGTPSSATERARLNMQSETLRGDDVSPLRQALIIDFNAAWSQADLCLRQALVKDAEDFLEGEPWDIKQLPSECHRLFNVLIGLDGLIQQSSLTMAVKVLSASHWTRLDPGELKQILERALSLIETLEKIHTKRIYWKIYAIPDSNDIWYQADFASLLVRLDLKSFRTNEARRGEVMEQLPLGAAPIDIEAVRRALVDRLQAIRTFDAAMQHRDKAKTPARAPYLKMYYRYVPKFAPDLLETCQVMVYTQPFPGYCFHPSWPPDDLCFCNVGQIREGSCEKCLEAIRNDGEKVRFLEELKFYTRALWCLNDWENFEDERRSVRLYFLEKLLIDVEERHKTFFPVFFFSYEDEEHRGVYLGREVDDLHINGLNEPWLGDHGLMQRATGTVRMIPFAALMPALLLLYGNLLARTNCGRIKHLLAALWEDTRPPWESSYPSRNLYKEDQERQAKECEEECGPDEYAQSRLSRAYTI